MADGRKIKWIDVQTDYILSPTLSLRQLADKHAINYSHLKEIAGREHWLQQREEVHGIANRRLADQIVESISDVKLRHAKLGKTLQSVGLGELLDKNGTVKLKPKSAFEASHLMRTGVQMERDALGLNEKQVKDEVYEKFSQYLFIFNLKDDELRNFIKSVDASTEGEVINSGETVLQDQTA